jgi:DNA polymerase
MASAIYGKDIKEIDADERFVGKTTILGSGYGMGALKFQAQLKNFGVEVPLDECQRIIDTYRETYERIPLLWEEARRAIIAMVKDESAPLGREGVLSVEGRDGIRLPNGLYLRYPNLRRWTNEDTGKVEYVYDTKKGKATIPNRIYGGKLIENICQALARIVIGDQMLLVSKKYRVVMTVHDAIASVVPVDERDRAKEFVELCMRMRPSWGPDLPLNCEAGYGFSYGDCK